MASDKGRKCPTCSDIKTGRAFQNSEQCTQCRRDIDKAYPPQACRVESCQKAFSQSHFHFETGRGWRKECKACHIQQQKDYKANIEDQPPRSCQICTSTKPARDFEGQRNTCRTCKAEQDKKKAAFIPKADPSTLEKPSHCASCSKSMGLDDLTLRKDTHLGSYRPICRSCLAVDKNGVSHSQNCRKRQRERPDYQDIKRHKSRQNQDWHARNPGKKAEYQATYRALAECKMQQIIQSAKQRGIAVIQEDVPAMTESLTEPCFYCGYVPAQGQPVNGLDRVDSSIKEYSTANTVSCCAACNHIKAFRSIPHYILHMRRVATQPTYLQLEDASAIDASFRQQCQHRERPVKADLMSTEEKLSLQTQPCAFCSVVPSCGIDRIDSGGDYSMDNVQPCCQECNYGKSSNSSFIFKSHAAAVAAHTIYWVLQPVTCCYNITGQQVQPVACYRGGILSGVFFSLSRAAAAIGHAKCSIADAIVNGAANRGVKWRNLTYEEYTSSKVSASAAECLMQKPVSERNHAAEQSKRRKLVLTRGDGLPVEAESVTAAAHHIGCSKSAISQALSKCRAVKGWKVVDEQ